jgi:hypothetical protein
VEEGAGVDGKADNALLNSVDEWVVEDRIQLAALVQG